MITTDYKIYKEHLMNSLLTVRQTEIMTDILDRCFSKDIQPAVANTLVTNYYNNVLNIVLPTVERLQKPSAGSPCDLCKLVSSKDVYLRSTYTGDLGNISPLALFDNAIKDLFEHRINNLHFGSLSTISATSKNVTGISSLENIVLLTKPIGFRRASGVALNTAKDVQVYCNSNPLLKKGKKEFKQDVAKFVFSDAEKSKYLLQDESLVIANNCGSFYVSLKTSDFFTEKEMKEISKKLGIRFTSGDTNTGFFDFMNIPMFTFTVDNTIENLKMIEYMFTLLVAFANKSVSWFKFVDLYRDAVISNL